MPEARVYRIVLTEFPDSQPIWTEDPAVADSFRASSTPYTVTESIPVSALLSPAAEEAAAKKLWEVTGSERDITVRAAPKGDWENADNGQNFVVQSYAREIVRAALEASVGEVEKS
jgi:hypothetical protein